MRRQRNQTGHLADKLYALPFLLACVLFVWVGASELLPGKFGEAWTILASGMTLYAWIGLLGKPSLSWKTSPPMMEGAENAASSGVDGFPPEAEDPLMAEVDRILGLEGVLEAKLEADAEQRERLEEVKALYELHSISETEYERKFREIMEEKDV